MDDTEQQGGLSALSMTASTDGLPGADILDRLATQPIMDPSTRWLKFAAGALAPTGGGRFSESLGNAVGALAGADTQEAELRAKYLPLVAQALLMRQQNAIQLQMNQTQMLSTWDDALTGQLTGLLTRGQPTLQDAHTMIGGLVRQQQVPAWFASQYFSNLPKDPGALRAYILSKAIGSMGKDVRVGAATPKVEIRSPDEGGVPVNVNPNAQPVGAMPGGTPSQLKPNDKLPKTFTSPQGERVLMPTTGKSALVGTPEAEAVVREGMGEPPSVMPGAVSAPVGASQLPPGQPTPQPQTALRAPSVPATQDLAGNKAAEGAGTAFAKYAEDLNTEVGMLSALAFRTQQSREYLKQFRTGATGEVRAKGAAFAKDLALSLGASQGYADALGNGLAGGDLASAQAFAKLSIQGSMEALKVAAGAGQRFTQAEFQQFQKANPNIEMDPRAIEKINDFVMQNYRRVAAEQEFVAQQRAQGVPVETIRVNWARQKSTLNQNQPTLESNKARGTVGPSAKYRIGTSASGRRMREVNGVWEYED